MKQTLVILVVGLTPRMVGPNTPNIQGLANSGGIIPMHTHMPAVTCTTQSTLLTGLPPNQHGAVSNGWYFRDLSEVWLWRQSNRLINGEKLWEAAKKINPEFTCAKMFWWYNMYSSADWSATPRPMYPANGLKIPDHYAHPIEFRDELNKEFGPFPLFKFWGPMTDNESSDWISKATKFVMETRNPTLTLCYLPHLDYNLQRLGPDLEHKEIIKDLRQVDANCGFLIEYAKKKGFDVIIVSEYGINPVTDAVHINRILRDKGLLAVKPERGREYLDAGASLAFAVSDHQIAHVYIQDTSLIRDIKLLLERTDGIEIVLDKEGQKSHALDHPRSGELVALASPERWFSYYYWLDENKAPDFAPTVDIHRKPGYDPMELFIDPKLKLPKASIIGHLMKKTLGFRTLLKVTPITNTKLIKGSHGVLPKNKKDWPLVISNRSDLLPKDVFEDTKFKKLVLDHVFSQ